MGMNLIFNYLPTINRFITDEPTNVQSIISRFKQIHLGIEQGKSSFFGVGLGNYYDNLQYQDKKSFISHNTNEIELSSIAQEYIHNNIVLYYAESGILSLIIFLLLIIIFAYRDILDLIYNSNLFRKALIISFWTLFIHGFLNPPIAGSYQILFWGIRGVLI